jgi:hypothetical protein
MTAFETPFRQARKFTLSACLGRQSKGLLRMSEATKLIVP